MSLCLLYELKKNVAAQDKYFHHSKTAKGVTISFNQQQEFTLYTQLHDVLILRAHISNLKDDLKIDNVIKERLENMERCGSQSHEWQRSHQWTRDGAARLSSQ